MKILEQYINSKNGNLDVCEDGILITDNFVCLVDGATAKGKLLWNGKKGGYFAKEVILEAVKEFDKDIQAHQAIKLLTEALRRQYGDNFDHFVNNPQDRIEASLLIYSKAKKQVWSYGDCQLMLDGKLYEHEKMLDKINSDARALYNTILLESGKTLEQLQEDDLGRKLILPILETQSLLANKDGEFGYGVLNGIGYNPNYIEVYEVEKNQEIVFASDGYPFLKSTLAESEKLLQEVLQKDPFLISVYKSTKGLMQGNISYDDRSYLKFKDE